MVYLVGDPHRLSLPPLLAGGASQLILYTEDLSIITHTLFVCVCMLVKYSYYLYNLHGYYIIYDIYDIYIHDIYIYVIVFLRAPLQLGAGCAWADVGSSWRARLGAWAGLACGLCWYASFLCIISWRYIQYRYDMNSMYYSWNYCL